MQGEVIENAGDKEVLVKTQSVIEVKIQRKRYVKKVGSKEVKLSK